MTRAEEAARMQLEQHISRLKDAVEIGNKKGAHGGRVFDPRLAITDVEKGRFICSNYGIDPVRVLRVTGSGNRGFWSGATRVMQRLLNQLLDDLPPGAYQRQDESADAMFYSFPRLVTHIDEHAIAAVTRLYRDWLPPGGAILDLMSSWVSHLPEEVAYGRVALLGMNAQELAANPRGNDYKVHDLNLEPTLPYADLHFLIPAILPRKPKMLPFGVPLGIPINVDTAVLSS